MHLSSWSAALHRCSEPCPRFLGAVLIVLVLESGRGAASASLRCWNSPTVRLRCSVVHANFACKDGAGGWPRLRRTQISHGHRHSVAFLRVGRAGNGG